MVVVLADDPAAGGIAHEARVHHRVVVLPLRYHHLNQLRCRALVDQVLRRRVVVVLCRVLR